MSAAGFGSGWLVFDLVGAAGSGYLDEGHIFDFVPTGSRFLTGGSVGPDGSIFAFLAMLAACGLLFSVSRRLNV